MGWSPNWKNVPMVMGESVEREWMMVDIASFCAIPLVAHP
jgi:hypothetical protein